MPRDLDDATLKEYGLLAVKLATNAKTRRAFIKQVKEVEPDRRFPDADVADLREEMETRLEQERLDRATEETTRRLSAARAMLISSGRYTEDQVKEIETKMQSLGLSDYEAGAILYSNDRAPAHPSNHRPKPEGGPWSLPELPGLLDDPITAARNQAYAEIDRINAAHR
jgi:hypothetical protein